METISQRDVMETAAIYELDHYPEKKWNSQL